MANSTKDSRNKVSLEELLRFKKAERPDEDFWKGFDSELHQRMMQTLVKKDPWFVQVMHGLSGKVAQVTAVSAAAAVLAFMVVQPALVTSFAPSGDQDRPALAHADIGKATAPETSEDKFDPALMAGANYEIEVVSASAAEGKNAVTQDYGLDHIEVASYDNDAYSADMALSGFTSTGVASLVY